MYGTVPQLSYTLQLLALCFFYDVHENWLVFAKF